LAPYYEHGRLRPAHVELGPLPPPGSRAEGFDGRQVVRLLLGLRLAVDEQRPLPYSGRFCAEALSAAGSPAGEPGAAVARANRRCGVRRQVDAARRPHRTKLYQAP
jgi:hypothetical protein